MSDYLFCCRSAGELEAVQQEVERGQFGGVYRLQSNLAREKTGYRCTICGKCYPFLTIHHQGEILDPKPLTRAIGKRLKYKKASYVFRGDHYYATCKKSLLRFDINGEGKALQTEEFPIMSGVYQVDVSPDGRYIATETFGGTVAVMDAAAKEIIARKRSTKLSGDFIFDQENRLLYYKDDSIRLWDFPVDRERVLWQAPEGNVHCGAVLRLDRERILFQLYKGEQRFAVILRNLAPEQVCPLAGSWVHAELSYVPELDQYTLPTRERVIVYDGQFRVVDTFPYPDLHTCQDGGGMFPVTAFADQVLKHAHLSPDGKWVLLDYFNYILLMERGSGKLRYCVWSPNGGATRFMGFLDERHIWYNWGDSTYIMEIAPGQEKT